MFTSGGLPGRSLALKDADILIIMFILCHPLHQHALRTGILPASDWLDGQF